MKQARLIKNKDQHKDQPKDQISNAAEKESANPEPQKQSSTIQSSVEAVRGWIRERQVSSQTQARQMFASLFVQPQAE